MPLPRRLATLILALLAVILPQGAQAQTFPQLTGRVVDAAHILPADVVARLDQKLAALEQQSQRQLVVATLPDLQGYDIEDYGYRLGRAWAIGDKQRNDGAILIVAPKERKVRIEVGYGLEPILTDGLSTIIIQQQVLPRFKAGDMPGGIEAGTDALIHQLQLPPDEAQKIAAQAQAHPAQPRQKGSGFGALIWIGFFVLFFVLPMLRRRRGYGGSGLGPVVVWSALDAMSRGGRGGGWGGGSGWGGGGGFSGGGGSFGGGGSSGSW
jgi:uncharacterized protein